MDSQRIAVDEARRITQHERIKGKLEEDVHARIAQEAATRSPAEQAEVESVAAGLKHKATAEVAETEGELGRAHARKALGSATSAANPCTRSTPRQRRDLPRGPMPNPVPPWEYRRTRRSP
jgi:hypothetical protein